MKIQNPISSAEPDALLRNQFHIDGFLSVTEVVSPSDLKQVQQLLDPLFERLPELPEAQVRNLSNPSLGGTTQGIPEVNQASRFESRLLETLAFQKCRAMAHRVLGGPVHFWGDHAIYKAAGGPETPWHQDQAYNGVSVSIPGVTMWLPLQAVDEINGCMVYLPQSHRDGLKMHRRHRNDPKAHSLELCEVDKARAVVCPLPTGGVTIHGDYAPHSALGNASSSVRRAWILSFSRHRRKGAYHIAVTLLRKVSKKYRW